MGFSMPTGNPQNLLSQSEITSKYKLSKVIIIFKRHIKLSGCIRFSDTHVTAEKNAGEIADSDKTMNSGGGYPNNPPTAHEKSNEVLHNAHSNA